MAQPTKTPDSEFFLNADSFFPRAGVALTYDDVSLSTLYSDILPRDADTTTDLGRGLVLSVPIISSDMDTVTESRMAIALALNGGMGILHYNMGTAEQIREVASVKHHVHGVISRPITVKLEREGGLTIGHVLAMVAEKGYGFHTFPVVDGEGKLAGLLPGTTVRERHAAKKVADVMVKGEALLVVREAELGDDPIRVADRFFDRHPWCNKLPVVDDEGRLKGLITASDIERILHETSSKHKPNRDADFRLRVAAAMPTTRRADGTLDTDKLAEHAAGLVAEGVDAFAVSTAHGHTAGVGEAVKFLSEHFKDVPVIAGNVTTAAAVDYLAGQGASVVKVGQGPGSICTTRLVAGVGIPQMTALYVCSRSESVRKGKTTLLADGGINKSGDIVKALTLAHGVVLGGLLAGCPEAPGELLEIDGKVYKRYRGMGSLSAMAKGSAIRYGHTAQAAGLKKTAAEGVEAIKEAAGPVSDVLATLVGGLQSGMGYLGAVNLASLRDRALYCRVSPAGQKEAAPHDIIELKASTTAK